VNAGHGTRKVWHSEITVWTPVSIALPPASLSASETRHCVAISHDSSNNTCLLVYSGGQTPTRGRRAIWMHTHSTEHVRFGQNSHCMTVGNRSDQFDRSGMFVNSAPNLTCSVECVCIQIARRPLVGCLPSCRQEDMYCSTSRDWWRHMPRLRGRETGRRNAMLTGVHTVISECQTLRVPWQHSPVTQIVITRYWNSFTWNSGVQCH